MVRRPLDPLPIAQPFWSEPEQTLVRLFDFMERDTPRVDHALMKFSNFDAALLHFGFDSNPLGKRWFNPRVVYPVKPFEGERQNGFLCWGVKAESNNHYCLEIGDWGRIIRFDFRRNKDESHSRPFVQLDELRIWDANNCFSLDCSNRHHEAFINNLRGLVSQTIAHLNENDSVSANQTFSHVGSFLQQLYRAVHPTHPSRYVA